MADNVDLAQLALDQTLPDPVPYGLPFARDCSLVKGVPRFLARTYELVSDPATDYCIAWSREGTSFIIHDRDALIKDVLAQFFSHANLASFIRQINMYSMRKVGPASTQEFFHPAFIRGHPNLLKYIKRRRGVNAAAAAAAAGGSAPMETSVAGGASPPAPQIAKQIAVLKHERVELEEDIAMLRETQAAMESQLDRVVGANLLLREELKAALAQQQRMQATVSEIMRLLPAAAASGVFASAAAAPSAPAPPSVLATATTATTTTTATKRSRTAAGLDDDATAERTIKRPRVDTSRQGLQAAPAATISSLPVQSPEPTSAKFLDAFFRELNGTSGATPMLMSAVLDETQHGGQGFPNTFAVDFGGSTLSPLFRREKTPFSAAFFKTPAAASTAAAVAAAAVAAAAAASASQM